MVCVKEIFLVCLFARLAVNERPWMPYLSKYLTFCLHSRSKARTHLGSHMQLKNCQIPEKPATSFKCNMSISSLYGRISSNLDMNCHIQTYALVVSSHFHLNLTVSEFMLHHGWSGQCLYGNVTILERQQGNRRPIVHGEYCGHLPPWTVYSYSNKLFVTHFNQHLHRDRNVVRFEMFFSSHRCKGRNEKTTH